MFKQNYKQLVKELRKIARNTNNVHHAQDLEKKRAVLNYQKLTAMKERQPTATIDAKLAELASAAPQFRYNNNTLKQLASEPQLDILEKHGLEHLSNVHNFLRAQREYMELLERYNPGLTMTQEDNVRKTAAKVGLQVPEN